MTYEEFSQEGIKLFEQFKKANFEQTNYLALPINSMPFDKNTVALFNNISDWLCSSGLGTIIRTKSGGICKTNGAYFPAYDIRDSRAGVEITIVSKRYGSMRLQWRNVSKELFTGNRMNVSGTEAFRYFNTICKKHKIDLGKYAEKDKEKAKANKESIEKPYIRFYNEDIKEKYLNQTLTSCHHLDYHSSYLTGLVNTYPEFRPVVEEIYAKRKSNNLKYKAILNMTQGYMESKMCGYKYAHLTKAMKYDNNRRLDYLTKCLIESGREVILYNTDGIWYKGELYHGPGEGDGIGCWANDYVNCTLRIKSEGAYEFICDGKYTAKLRGQTTYALEVDREDWKWGDIYKGVDIQYHYDPLNKKLYFNNELLGGKDYGKEF